MAIMWGSDVPVPSLREELAMLRQLEAAVRERVCQAVPEWAPELREILARLDAARG